MIKALFFDIDDTILDYDLCAAFTVRKACETLGVPYSQAVQTEYRRVDDELWAQQKLGILTIPEVLDKRDAHMMEYHCTIDKSEIMPFAAIGMDLEMSEVLIRQQKTNISLM